jgi:hypothetical protein
VLTVPRVTTKRPINVRFESLGGIRCRDIFHIACGRDRITDDPYGADLADAATALSYRVPHMFATRQQQKSASSTPCRPMSSLDIVLQCAPGAGQVEVSALTGCAGLSKDGSHGQTAFAQHRVQAAGRAGRIRKSTIVIVHHITGHADRNRDLCSPSVISI